MGPFRCWAVMLNKARRRRGLAGGSSSAPLVGTSYCHRPTEATGSFLHAGVLPGFGGDIHPAFNTQHHPYALPAYLGGGQHILPCPSAVTSSARSAVPVSVWDPTARTQ